jgi:hypothetical protein
MGMAVLIIPTLHGPLYLLLVAATLVRAVVMRAAETIAGSFMMMGRLRVTFTLHHMMDQVKVRALVKEIPLDM